MKTHDFNDSGRLPTYTYRPSPVSARAYQILRFSKGLAEACKVEHPVLNELSKNGIRIVGLNYKDVREAAIKYLEFNGNPYQQNIYDESGDLGLDLGVYGAPETFLIDAEGVIRYRHVGVVTPENWRELLWPKWQEMGGKGP